MWIFEWPLGWFRSGGITIFDRTGIVVKSNCKLAVAKTGDRKLITKSLSKVPVAKTFTNRI